MQEIFIPTNPINIKRAEISRFLQNIEEEIDLGLFNPDEISLLKHPKLYGKYLDSKSRSFFLYHFLPLWEKSIKILFADNPRPKIVDLGCGMGTSSLLFALLGAKAVGIDLNEKLINVCQKQKNFYQNYVKKLDIDFYDKNVFNFSFQDYTPIDAFFSLFAFNLMQPYDILLTRLVSFLECGGKIIIIDGNMGSLYSRFIPSRQRPGVPNPIMVQKKLRELGCQIIFIEYHCAVPPFVFRVPVLKQFALKLEEFIKAIKLYKFFGASYTIVAEKI